VCAEAVWPAEYVKQAVELDTDEKYEQAFEYYMKGLEQFSLHCKYDKNPASRDAIQKKMGEYMKRAEYLKSVINSNTRTDGAAGETSAAVGQKKKPPVRVPVIYALPCWLKEALVTEMAPTIAVVSRALTQMQRKHGCEVSSVVPLSQRSQMFTGMMFRAWSMQRMH
jgi:hypothetical protein